MLIVGDSIIKDMSPIEGVVIRSFPGATIGKLSFHFSEGHISLENHDYLIVHVGTNNIGRRDKQESIMSDYGNLIAQIKKIKPTIKVIISAILPRPLDHQVTDQVIREINNKLKNYLAPDLGCKFVCSYKAVCKFGTYRQYLYAKLDGGLHLNFEGSNRLRYFFLRVISTID